MDVQKQLRKRLARTVAQADQLAAYLRENAPEICDIYLRGLRTQEQVVLAWQCTALVGAQQQIASMERILNETI